MNARVRRWALGAVGAMLGLAAGFAWSQAPSPVNAGQFLTVVGDVRVLSADGTQRTPQRGCCCAKARRSSPAPARWRKFACSTAG